jgi:asparagine synthase (glutamine-hydrolysing)
VCGIVGVVHRDRALPVERATIGTMCTAIRHRGPDDEGIHVDGGAGLGMRRLSIIDLAGSHQPIFNEDRSQAIVFNGEIYNYRPLRDGLIARGHTLQTQGDTETILHLYEERGAGCVDNLRGMFAFAIWDATAEGLLLARDRFGIKPLYYVSGSWGIAFASELKALLAVGMSDRELDWEALDTYLQLGYIPAPATPFRDVRKLEPGHTLWWDRRGTVTQRRYWDVPTGALDSGNHAAARVRDWLDDSVAAHLVSDVPVAAFLSGGLDSSAVVASMALRDGRPHAFTAHYHGSGAADANETPLAQALADRYRAQLTTIDIRPELDRILEPIVYALDEPHADDSAIPTWLLSQAVGARYKVALTGIGGDELFAGYRRHIGLLLGHHYDRLPAPLRRFSAGIARRLREPENASLGVNRLKRFLNSAAATPPDRFLGYVTRSPDAERAALYAPALADRIEGTAARAQFRELYESGGAPAGLRAGLYLDYKTFLPDDILALSDRLSMAHSLEVRVPFVDHVLVEHVFALSDATKIGWWQRKHLLRQALKPRLPAAHFKAPKRGFVGPTSAWLRGELRGPLHDELSAARLDRLGYFSSDAVQRLLREHETREHNREGILWALFCFMVWHRLFMEATPPARYRPAG